jgi:hypothetical protein
MDGLRESGIGPSGLEAKISNALYVLDGLKKLGGTARLANSEISEIVDAFTAGGSWHHGCLLIYMDRFSLAVLERTVELVVEAMSPDSDPRVAGAVNLIQRYIEAPDDHTEKELHPAVKSLLAIARENHQFLIAARLSSIDTRLNETSGRSDVA